MEKRKATARTTPLTPNAQSEHLGRLKIPKCIHGAIVGEGCAQCDEQSEKINQEIERGEEERRQKREREYGQWIAEKKNNPESRMSNIPGKFRPSSFDKFQGGEVAKKKCREFIEKYDRNIKSYPDGPCVDWGVKDYPGSLLFTGPTGCGKTHLAIATYRELIKENRDGETLFITTPELLLEIRATFNTKKNIDDPDQTEGQVIDKYSKVELLILDDLGSEKTSDFTIQSLYLIIDRRNRNLKPTIITTNLSLQEIEEKLDARIASRLSDMTVIKINMPDYRKRR